MKSFGMVLGAAVLLGLGCSASVAQTAEPSYKADPDTYKVIFEDANYRVIEANHKKGIHDKVHSHPVSFVAPCQFKPHAPPACSRRVEGEMQ